MRTTVKCLPVVLALVGGCSGNPYFSDDEGAPRPSSSWASAHPDELSQPYALGTKVKISVKQIDSTQAASWQVTSDTPSVLTVDKLDVDGTNLTAECTAHAEGAVTIHLRDASGGDQRSATLTVKKPDTAKVFHHGPLRLDGNDSTQFAAAEATEVRVVAGGTAVYAVAYFAGSERAFGRGLLTIDPVTSMTASNMTTSGMGTNEWLFVTPAQTLNGTLTMHANGVEVATLPVIAVADSEVKQLTVNAQAGTVSNDNQQVWVYAQAQDSSGKPIDGVYSSWTLEGVAQTQKDDKTKTLGDLFRFEFDPSGTPKMLVASHNGIQAATSIKAHDGWVSDTTYLGCSVAAGHSRGSPLIAMFFVVGLMGIALRRRARS